MRKKQRRFSTNALRTAVIRQLDADAAASLEQWRKTVAPEVKEQQHKGEKA